MTFAYIDTSVLAGLYCLESNSDRAITLIKTFKPPLPICIWQELEARNAFRLKQFRGELTDVQVTRALQAFDTDFVQQRWFRISIDTAQVFATAEDVSASFTSKIGCRTLDVLHVACAIELKCQHLLTFDKRQADVARRAGLVVV